MRAGGQPFQKSVTPHIRGSGAQLFNGQLLGNWKKKGIQRFGQTQTGVNTWRTFWLITSRYAFQFLNIIYEYMQTRHSTIFFLNVSCHLQTKKAAIWVTTSAAPRLFGVEAETASQADAVRSNGIFSYLPTAL